MMTEACCTGTECCINCRPKGKIKLKRAVYQSNTQEKCRYTRDMRSAVRPERDRVCKGYSHAMGMQRSSYVRQNVHGTCLTT